MDSSLYDVTLAVPSHGIHNPVNLHSCRPHPCYVPTECTVCKYVVFPLMSAATCVRCSQCYHRECVKDIKTICNNFIMKEKIAAISVGATNGNSSWSSTDEAETFDHLVKGTEPIWSDILVELSGKFKIATIDIKDTSHLKMHDLVLELLGDNAQFPGTMTSAVRRLYLRHNYKTNHTAVVEARKGLDQIASCVFCVLPTEVAADYDEVKSIINLADRYALAKNDNSMYEKVMAAATALANKSDEALFNHLNKDYSEPVDESICSHAVTDAFFKVLQAVTAMDKLMALSHALRACVAEDGPAAPGPESLPVRASLGDLTNDGTGRLKEDSTRRKSGGKTELTPHGADALIERLITVLCFLSKRYKLRWHAQCTFIELMCPDTSWLFGAEGYSLVTLQQVLCSLLPHVPQHDMGSISSSSHGCPVATAPPGASATASIAISPSFSAGDHLDRLRSASVENFATE